MERSSQALQHLPMEAAPVDPFWRTRILAPAIEYLAHPDDDETPVYRRSARILEESRR